jgi:hypothetical protein
LNRGDLELPIQIESSKVGPGFANLPQRHYWQFADRFRSFAPDSDGNFPQDDSLDGPPLDLPARAGGSWWQLLTRRIIATQIHSVGIDLGKTTFHLVALGAAGKAQGFTPCL